MLIREGVKALTYTTILLLTVFTINTSAYEDGVVVGTFDSVIDEASGLAPSMLNDDVLYTHNDSGGGN